jgi:hypothetical protein
MQIVQVGNIYYFIYIFAFFALTILSLIFLKNKSQKFRNRFIFGLAVLNLVIHFAKIFIYPYTTVEYIWTKVSFENVCAVSALTFPFLYFVKNKTIKDYMILVGISSGILTFIFPVDAISEYFNGAILGYKEAFSIEVIRFYTSHFLIFLVPFLMMQYKFHTLSIKRAYRAPLVLILVLVIIYINELVITALGWVPREQLYSPDYRNPSFIFGVRGDLTGLGAMLGAFVPVFLRIHPVTGELFYWPVIWLAIPAIIYSSLFTMVLMIVYDGKNTILYFQRIFGMHPREQKIIE